jgi:lipopolysaccharide export system protein LptC
MSASWRSFSREHRVNNRHKNGARLALFIGLGAVFALGSFWLVQVMNGSDMALQIDRERGESDYFVDNFSIVRMAPNGLPAYLVSGTRLIHHPLDDSSDIEQPFVRKFTPGLPPTDMRAERARVDQDNSRVVLTGNVRLDRAAAPGIKNVNLRTPALTVFPDADKMQTDQPVEINHGTALLTGTGMAADNGARQIEIAHAVRITYPPAPR